MIAVARAIMAPSPRITRCRELPALVARLPRTGRSPGARFNVDVARAASFSYAQGNAAVDSEPDLFRLRTILGSARAGSLRNKLGFIWRLRSLWAKMSLLAVIFALVPLFLYFEFSKTYQDSQDLLMQSVRGQGRVMSQSLLPLLENADGKTLLGLGQQLERFAGEVTTIKLLLDPAGSDDDGFYYIASWPTVVASNLEAERQIPARRGVLGQLTQSCRGELPFSLIYDRPTGGSEIVTVVTPLLTAVGCWAVVASFSADAFPAARLGHNRSPSASMAGIGRRS